jgi:hypothetical protein
VPEELVRDDYGLGGIVWERFRSKNPHVIKYAQIDGDGRGYYNLEGDNMHWSWPPDAFVLHQEPATVEVGDLL